MIELLRKRRSIRKYLKCKIEAEKIELLQEALLRSPSSRNLQPWEFIFIQDAKLLLELSKAKTHGSEFLAEAALGIVIFADEKKSDVWIEDCSIAAIIVQLTAESLGLGSCWIQIRNRKHSQTETSEEYLQKLLNLQSHSKIECIIAVGYPDEKKAIVPIEKLNYQKIKMI